MSYRPERHMLSNPRSSPLRSSSSSAVSSSSSSSSSAVSSSSSSSSSSSAVVKRPTLPCDHQFCRCKALLVQIMSQPYLADLIYSFVYYVSDRNCNYFNIKYAWFKPITLQIVPMLHFGLLVDAAVQESRVLVEQQVDELNKKIQKEHKKGTKSKQGSVRQMIKPKKFKVLTMPAILAMFQPRISTPLVTSRKKLEKMEPFERSRAILRLHEERKRSKALKNIKPSEADGTYMPVALITSFRKRHNMGESTRDYLRRISFWLIVCCCKCCGSTTTKRYSCNPRFCFGCAVSKDMFCVKSECWGYVCRFLEQENLMTVNGEFPFTSSQLVEWVNEDDHEIKRIRNKKMRLIPSRSFSLLAKKHWRFSRPIPHPNSSPNSNPNLHPNSSANSLPHPLYQNPAKNPNHLLHRLPRFP